MVILASPNTLGHSPNARLVVTMSAQLVLGVDGDLDVVTDDPAAAAAGRHRTGVRIGQRELLVGRGIKGRLQRLEGRHPRRSASSTTSKMRRWQSLSASAFSHSLGREPSSASGPEADAPHTNL